MTTADVGWLYRLGLHRPELRAWAMYDWANSAFATTVMGALMGPYFKAVPAGHLAESVSTAYWAYTTSLALFIVALISPVLGATADFMGAKKRFLGGFAGLGIIFTSFLWFAGSGDWVFTSAVYIVANVGFAAANVFYESLLPSIASREEIDRVSVAGYAVGYVGGGILLAINAAWIMFPETFGLVDEAHAIRLSFVSVSVWWALFSVPLFRTVREPTRNRAAHEGVGRHPLVVGFARVRRTFGEIRQNRQVFLFLLAYWLYNDGIGTIIKMATRPTAVRSDSEPATLWGPSWSLRSWASHSRSPTGRWRAGSARRTGYSWPSRYSRASPSAATSSGRPGTSTPSPSRWGWSWAGPRR